MAWLHRHVGSLLLRCTNTSREVAVFREITLKAHTYYEIKEIIKKKKLAVKYLLQRGMCGQEADQTGGTKWTSLNPNR